MTEAVPSKAGLFFKLARVQFVPVMVAPVILGASAAYLVRGSIDLFLFGLVLLGSVCLHIAANLIDDVCDSMSGVDQVVEKMMPKDFPGWKPMQRGLATIGYGLKLSILFYAVSLAIGVYLSFAVGWLALGIAIPGVLLSYFYVGPPLKLDYRGLGLGEIAIILCFGPIPALGSYYVLTGSVSAFPVLLSISSGMNVVNILVTHDMILYDAYKAFGKRSLTVVLGRSGGAKLVWLLGAIEYSIPTAAVLAGYAPVTSLLIFAALPLFLKSTVRGANTLLPGYGPKVATSFVHCVVFTLLLSAGFLLATVPGL